MLKAALFTPNLTMGGAERWVVSLASSVDRRRLQWTGAMVSGWGGLDRSLSKQLADHVSVHTNDGGWNGQTDGREIAKRYFSKIHKDFGKAMLAACRDADVLVAWGGVDPKQFAPNLRIPIVQTSHTTEPAASRECGSRSATHFAAVSEAARAYFAPLADVDNVDVIYNGADTCRCLPTQGRTAIRAQWGLGPTNVAVGYLGRHSLEKNPQAAIDAVSKLPKIYRAIYYGGPTPRDQVTTLKLRDAANSKAPERVIFEPTVEHVGDVLAGLDVFMLASHREAFSLALIEAWIAGVPIVATPVGSLPELEKRFGKLTVQVPIKARPSTLAKAVRIANDSEGKRIAKRARNIALEHFTNAAMANRWTNYLQKITSPTRKRMKPSPTKKRRQTSTA